MQKTSGLYKTLLSDPLTEKEIRLVIAGTSYGMKDIISVSTSGGMFSKPDIGCCGSRQIDLEIYPIGDIPRQAKIQIFVRLVLGNQASEWLPKGVFFISTRHRDKRTGALTIHGFDAMLKSDVVWLTDNYPLGYLPKSEQEVVEDIASRMGVEVDERTKLCEISPVNYPEVGNESLTMREILEFIAVANAGNWVITDKGKLLLLRYFDIPADTGYLITEYGAPITFGGTKIIVDGESHSPGAGENSGWPDKTYVGLKAAELDYGDQPYRITRITLKADSEHIYTDGDDSGGSFSKDCIFATQEMAEIVQSYISGKSYIHYTSRDTLLDMAAEIGDGVMVGGVYSVIAQSTITFDKMCVADISAPSSPDMEDEYPYLSAQARKLERVEDKIEQIEQDLDHIQDIIDNFEGGGLDAVLSFNERTGHVVPEVGDYTEEIEGAIRYSIQSSWEAEY